MWTRKSKNESYPGEYKFLTEPKSINKELLKRCHVVNDWRSWLHFPKEEKNHLIALKYLPYAIIKIVTVK